MAKPLRKRFDPRADRADYIAAVRRRFANAPPGDFAADDKADMANGWTCRNRRSVWSTRLPGAE